MKLHGLVLFLLWSLSPVVLAQTEQIASESFLPPSPRQIEVDAAEPVPLAAPDSTVVPAAPAVQPKPGDMESELKAFRTELREFQAAREDVARTTRATDAATDQLSTHQRQELLGLLAKLAKQSLARNAATPAPAPKAAPAQPAPAVVTPAPTVVADDAQPPADSVSIADPFSLGKVLFRSGDFAGAEKAFRKVMVTPENEMMVKYLIATCQRRQSRWKSAMESYKTVADSNQDPVLRDLARWQLDNIKWHQQSESQLEHLRQERDKRTGAAGPSANAAGPTANAAITK